MQPRGALTNVVLAVNLAPCGSSTNGKVACSEKGQQGRVADAVGLGSTGLSKEI